MKPRLIRLFLLLLILQMLLPAQIALADTGPKPKMEFTFKQEQDLLPMSITSGTMYECDQADCSDASPLEELGPQGFRCDAENCSATAYGFARYHQIEIQFSDGKTRESNIFQTAGFDSKYTVTVGPDDLLVEAQFSLGVFPRLAAVLIACVCALIGVGLVVGLIIFLIRRSKKT
jgi:hypothetical protein